MAIIGHVLAYQQFENGSLVPQTKARCEAAAICYHNGRINRITITAGISRGGILIADAMKKYFEETLDVHPDDILISNFGANTATEIEAVWLFHLGPNDQVIAISSWYHLPRIWWLYRARGIRAKLVSAWGGVSIIDIALEPLKILNNILRPNDFKFAQAAPT